MDVYRWALKAQPGDRVTYFREQPNSDWDDPTRRAVLGKAMTTHDLGLVFLAQRIIRRGPERGTVCYEATRIHHTTAARLGLRVGDPLARSVSFARALEASR